jgi:hypothetical protein
LLLHALLLGALIKGAGGRADGAGARSNTEAGPQAPLLIAVRMEPPRVTEEAPASAAASATADGSPKREVPRGDPARPRGAGEPPRAASAASQGNGVNLAGDLPGVRYYRPDELTVGPRVIRDSASSQSSYIPDVHPLPVVVQVLINERGGVDRVLLGENFLSPEARSYIIESISGMSFSPGRIGDLPVRSQWQIVVNLESLKPPNQ